MKVADEKRILQWWPIVLAASMVVGAAYLSLYKLEQHGDRLARIEQKIDIHIESHGHPVALEKIGALDGIVRDELRVGFGKLQLEMAIINQNLAILCNKMEVRCR